jgi:hypothetical protein
MEISNFFTPQNRTTAQGTTATMFDPGDSKNLRSPFQKLWIIKDKAIFFLLENTKFIGICFSFDRENCKKHTQIYSVLGNLKVVHFRTLTLTTADQVNYM